MGGDGALFYLSGEWNLPAEIRPEPYQFVTLYLVNGLLRQGCWTGGSVWIIGRVAVRDDQVAAWRPADDPTGPPDLPVGS